MRLELLADGRVFDLAKSGPGYAYLRSPAEIPAGNAVFVMTVDGRKHRWAIRLKYPVVPWENEERIEFSVISGPDADADKPFEPCGPETKQYLLFQLPKPT